MIGDADADGIAGLVASRRDRGLYALGARPTTLPDRWHGRQAIGTAALPVTRSRLAGRRSVIKPCDPFCESRLYRGRRRKLVKRILDTLCVLPFVCSLAGCDDGQSIPDNDFRAAGSGGLPEPDASSSSGFVRACGPWSIDFDGRCLSRLNVASVIDLGSSDLKEMGNCEDTDGELIEGCVLVRLDHGSPGFGDVEYMLLDTPCTPTPFAGGTCFGGYSVHHRTVIETLVDFDARGGYVASTQTYQLPQSGLLGVDPWKDEMIVSKYISYAGEWDYSPMLTTSLDISAVNGAGEELFSHNVTYSAVAGSETSETSKADACAAIQNIHVQMGQAAGAVHDYACSVVMPLDHAEGGFEVDVGLFKIWAEVERDWDICEKGGAMNEAIGAAIGAKHYVMCIDDPAQYFPNAFGPEDEELDPEQIEVTDFEIQTADGDPASECLNVAIFANVVYWYTDGGTDWVCEGEAEVECGENAEGECECVATPLSHEDDVCVGLPTE